MSDGITFLAAGGYYEGDNKQIAKSLKVGDDDAVDYAASKMVSLLSGSSQWVLVPMPGHHGYAKETVKLCEAISMASGIPVCDALRGNDRMSNYEAKKNGCPLTEKDLGLHQVRSLPAGRIPVVVDNCVDTGVSAKAAIHALGKGIVLSFAITDVMLQEELLASKLTHTIKYK